MTFPAVASAPRSWIAAQPGRAAAAKAVGINFAGSAAFYLVVSDRKHWKAAVAAGVLGAWLYRAASAGDAAR